MWIFNGTYSLSPFSCLGIAQVSGKEEQVTGVKTNLEGKQSSHQSSNICSYLLRVKLVWLCYISFQQGLA